MMTKIIPDHEALRSLGLTKQEIKIFEFVLNFPDRVYISETAKYLGLTYQNLYRVLWKLERKGLLKELGIPVYFLVGDIKKAMENDLSNRNALWQKLLQSLEID